MPTSTKRWRTYPPEQERLRIEEESCDDFGGDEGMKHASRNYEVTGIDADKIPLYFDTPILVAEQHVPDLGLPMRGGKRIEE